MIKELLFLKNAKLESLSMEAPFFEDLNQGTKDAARTDFVKQYSQVKVLFLSKKTNLDNCSNDLKRTKVKKEISLWQRETNSELFDQNNSLTLKWETELTSAGIERGSKVYSKEMDKLSDRDKNQIHVSGLIPLINAHLEYWLLDNVPKYSQLTSEQAKERMFKKYRKNPSVMLMIKKIVCEENFDSFEVLKFNKIFPDSLCSFFCRNSKWFHSFDKIRIFLLQRKDDEVWEIFGENPFRNQKEIRQLFNLLSEVKIEIPVQSIVVDLNEQGSLKSIEVPELCIEENFGWQDDSWMSIQNLRKFNSFDEFNLEYLMAQKKLKKIC